eukprot:gene2062-2758_t
MKFLITTVLISFMFIALIGTGMEWRKQQLQERAIEQAQAANEIATLKKERSIALDMIKERDEELAVYKGRLEKLTTESQDQLSVASEKLKKQKTAASQLAEVNVLCALESSI